MTVDTYRTMKQDEINIPKPFPIKLVITLACLVSMIVGAEATNYFVKTKTNTVFVEKLVYPPGICVDQIFEWNSDSDGRCPNPKHIMQSPRPGVFVCNCDHK